ncbi:uncharacterized protein K452DRAFT_239841, partial [Aplosporella prunicola CBS 121167]
KTPFELVYRKKPTTNYLRVYSYKAYVLDKIIPKKKKLRARVLISYLVRYNSTNIFYI